MDGPVPAVRTIIRPSDPREGRARLLVRHARDTWAARDLAWVLARRELKARYRSSVLGYLWTLLNPLLQLAVYSLVFGAFLRVSVEAGGRPRAYTLFLFSGLLPWVALASTLHGSTRSLLSGGGLLKRAALAPQLLPLTRALTDMANLVLGLPVLLGAALLWGRAPGLALLWLPPLLLAQLLLAVGLGAILSCLAVRYRDVQFLVGTLVQLGFYLTPIVYPLDLVPARVAPALLANPMASIALGYQAIFFRGEAPPAWTAGLALGGGLIAYAAGAIFFERRRDALVEEV